MLTPTLDLLKSTDPAELVNVIVRLAAETLSADEVCLWVPDRMVLRLAARHGVDEQDVAARRVFAAAVFESRLNALQSRALIVDQASCNQTDRAIVAALRKANLNAAIAWRLISAGEVIGVLTVHRVTERPPFHTRDVEGGSVLASQTRLALENKRLVERSIAAERMACIGMLSASVAHEINNPLMYVLGNSAIALEIIDRLGRRTHVSPELAHTLQELSEALTDISEGGARIAEIAGDLRLLARSETVESERFDVSSAIRSALRITRALLRSARLTVDLDPELVVVGRPGRLGQVIVNLVANAAQAKDANGRPLEISVTAKRDGDNACIVVRDTGCGIAPEDIGRIFEPSFTTKPSDGGTGLGLSIARAIVEQHRGELSVASEVGVGTAFTLVVPLVGVEVTAQAA